MTVCNRAEPFCTYKMRLHSDHIGLNILAWIRILVISVLCVFPLHLAFSGEPGFDATLNVTGGAHRMFRKDIEQAVLEIDAWSKDSTNHNVTARWKILDILNRPKTGAPRPTTLHLPADGSKLSSNIKMGDQIGYYLVFVTLSEGSATITRSIDFGVVWPPYSGTRPDSFFATNSSPQQGEDLQLLETIGMKVQRGHFAPNVATNNMNWPKQMPPGQAVPLDFESMDREWKEMRAHGLWILPIAGNALVGANVFDRTPLADKIWTYGPPNDNERFIRTWENILKHYSEFTTIEFWNEPWVYGWTWAAPPDAYRQLQKDWCRMALAINPHYRLLAGNSIAFVRDEIEPFPDCWEGLLEGITNHPYGKGTVEKNLRGGDVFRSIDEIRLAATDLGLPYAYLTEGGTAYQNPQVSDKTERYNNIENAQKLVQYYASAALAGLFMGNAQWEIGYGPGWTKSNTAFAVLTHFLEDRVPLVDLWPRQPLLWGGIFANRKFATPAVRSLPRGSELAARLNVEVPPERGQDNLKVAVIWGLTGQSAQWLDTHGELVIANATDLRAYTMTGEVIPTSHGQLILPLSANPVYVTSEHLDVLSMRDRIQGALIRRLVPINFYALSLQHPAIEKQDLVVRLQNQINRTIKGTLTLQLPGQKQTVSSRFRLPSGELTNVRLKWPGASLRPDNLYLVQLTARLDKSLSGAAASFPPISQAQNLAVARFEKRTIHFTGALSDWGNLTPVIVGSRTSQKLGADTGNFLNPNEKKASNEIAGSPVICQVYTAYDDDFVYIGAAVQENHFHCSAGEPFTAALANSTITLPYLQGVPDGLRFITECGSVLQFSFGFRDRVPGIGRQTNDPWTWKGVFYDTDYSYVAHVSAQGDRLIRIWGPDTGRRNGYQTEAVSGIGPVSGGLINITRDEETRLTLYEVAIPRRQIALFDPNAGQCRFGFNLYNSDLPGSGALSWSGAANVFDYWQTPGSYPPTWKSHLACQTFFGIQP
jgi:hypothetical protein